MLCNSYLTPSHVWETLSSAAAAAVAELLIKFCCFYCDCRPCRHPCPSLSLLFVPLPVPAHSPNLNPVGPGLFKYYHPVHVNPQRLLPPPCSLLSGPEEPPSIMVAPYPQADERFANPAAETDMSAVKAAIHAGRSLRSSYGILPSVRAFAVFVVSYWRATHIFSRERHVDAQGPRCVRSREQP